MSMSPAIAIHLAAALGALVTGPVALWARQGAQQRPRLHRAFGYAWVTLMVTAAVSAIFIHDPVLPTVFGHFGPIHIFVPMTFIGLFVSFHALAKGDIRRHRQRMLALYYGANVIPGVFALLPNRILGKAVAAAPEVAVVVIVAGLAVLAIAGVRRFARLPQPTN